MTDSRSSSSNLANDLRPDSAPKGQAFSEQRSLSGVRPRSAFIPPPVSVIIPTYNSGKWVEETLASVHAQTYPRDLLELIVVDDMSPDDSVRVASTYIDEHEGPPSRVFAQKMNRGVAANRNYGWRMAKGEWIQFLDADDLLSPHKLLMQAEVAASAPEDVAVIYSSWQHYELQDGAWGPTGQIHQPSVDDDPVTRILQDYSFGYVGPTLIRRSFLEKVGGFIEKPNLGEDIDLMLRIAMAGGQFRAAHSEKVAFLYRQSPGSLWRNYVKNVEAMRNLLHTFKRAEEYLREKSGGRGISARAREALAWRYTRSIEFYLETDPQNFHMVMDWLRDLDVKVPPYQTRGMRVLSNVFGYENALRLRSGYRRRRYGTAL